jgi:hypothetical protein
MYGQRLTGGYDLVHISDVYSEAEGYSLFGANGVSPDDVLLDFEDYNWWREVLQDLAATPGRIE